MHILGTQMVCASRTLKKYISPPHHSSYADLFLSQGSIFTAKKTTPVYSNRAHRLILKNNKKSCLLAASTDWWWCAPLKGKEMRPELHTCATLRAPELPELPPRFRIPARPRAAGSSPRVTWQPATAPGRPPRIRGVASRRQPMGVSGGRGRGCASPVNRVRRCPPRFAGRWCVVAVVAVATVAPASPCTLG